MHIGASVDTNNEIDTVNSMIQNGAVTDRNGTKNYNRLI